MFLETHAPLISDVMKIYYKKFAQQVFPAKLSNIH